MDDIETIRRKRTIKVLITDIFMACSVAAIVFVLVAVVAGWRINSDFTVEQNGLVSIKTKPSGATVFIDGEEQFQSTNMSKMLPGGEHKIELEKEGYERWEKIIEVTPGWLLRLEYPRLIKQNREKNTIRTFEELKFFYVSPSRTTAILGVDDSTEWFVVSDFNTNPKFKKIDITGIFSDTSNGTFNHKIKSLEWSRDTNRILMKADDEWAVIDLKDIKNSVNLSNDYPRYTVNSNATLASDKKESQKILDAKFENEAGDKIVANVSNSLVRIDIIAKTASATIAEKIEKFALLDASVIYITKFEEGKNYIRFLNLGEKLPTTVAVNSNKEAVISFSLTRFNNTCYLLYTVNNHLSVYSAHDFPSGGGNKLNMKQIVDVETGIIPSEALTSNNREFMVLREGSRVVVFDSELETWHEYDYGDENIRFLDNYMLYRVDEASGKLLVWDFDSTNVRTLVVDNGINDFDALITQNDRFFYYIGKTNSGVALIQEKL